MAHSKQTACKSTGARAKRSAPTGPVGPQPKRAVFNPVESEAGKKAFVLRFDEDGPSHGSDLSEVLGVFTTKASAIKSACAALRDKTPWSALLGDQVADTMIGMEVESNTNPVEVSDDGTLFWARDSDGGRTHIYLSGFVVDETYRALIGQQAAEERTTEEMVHTLLLDGVRRDVAVLSTTIGSYSTEDAAVKNALSALWKMFLKGDALNSSAGVDWETKAETCPDEGVLFQFSNARNAFSSISIASAVLNAPFTEVSAEVPTGQEPAISS